MSFKLTKNATKIAILLFALTLLLLITALFFTISYLNTPAAIAAILTKEQILTIMMSSWSFFIILTLLALAIFIKYKQANKHINDNEMRDK